MSLASRFRTMLSNRIRELGMSKNKLSEVLDCTPQNVNQMLSTKKGKNHKLETVEKVSEALGMEVELTWKEKEE